MDKQYKYKCKHCNKEFKHSFKAVWFLSFCENVGRSVRVYRVGRSKKKRGKV